VRKSKTKSARGIELVLIACQAVPTTQNKFENPPPQKKNGFKNPKNGFKNPKNGFKNPKNGLKFLIRFYILVSLNSFPTDPDLIFF
jgi:hypothetical protein